MEVEEYVEQFNEGKECPRSAQRPVSETQNTVLYTVLTTEEVDSSIREFSYIWSPGGFDIGEPDTNRLGGGDGSCHIAIFKIDTENPDTQQKKPEEYEHSVAVDIQNDHHLPTLPATCYSANQEESSLDCSKSHRRDSSSVYTPIRRCPTATEPSADNRSISCGSHKFDGFTKGPPTQDDRSANYSDCLQGGQTYCNNRYRFAKAESVSLPAHDRRPHCQEDISYWQDASRGIQSSDLPRFQVDLPLPRSRSVGRRLISRMKFWNASKEDSASSKPRSYMSNSKRSITASIASSWSRKAKGYLKKASSRDTYLASRRAKSSQPSIRTVSPKSIFSRVQKSSASNYSDFMTELNSRTRVAVSTPPPETSLSTCSKELPTLDLEIQMPLGEPRPFQCTFCLMQWENKEEWAYHEAAFHMRPYGNLYSQDEGVVTHDDVMFSMSDVVSTFSRYENQEPSHDAEAAAEKCISFGYHLYSDNPQALEGPKRIDSWNWLEKRSNWFWNCGFCELILRTWAERQEHVAEHFEQGTTMISWNPLRSPYPISKFTMTPVEGFPPWDLSPLHCLQQPGFQDEVYRASQCPPELKCQTCEKHFPDTNASIQHTKLWHNTPESWICPGPEHASNPGVFFDTEIYTEDASDLASLNLDENPNIQADQASVNAKKVYTYDYCLCCGEIFSESPADWSARKQHLRDVHCICETDDIGYDHKHNNGEPFYREELFSLHLANCHNVRLEYLTEFTEICRKKAQPPVLMVQSGHLKA
ncbi:hypothetical protein CISG_04323 [Coccidioides immitis RMSCC 3703]|uniref:C2H2-type domain-containing protein n=1 Tax=Coccidioides immitis RMSCC 3703 TaxID=454286 RepID=A0A0J8QQ96_COCIT|nr:hypothetical protein CISG_04323 [Coccidioides immitis RMSCC 3703]